MKLVHARERLSKDERGFTLPEMMVTMVIMIVMLFSLYSIFDMSLRVFSFGNDEVEATENARIGLERMERELRAAYPADRADPNKRYLFFTTSNPGAGAVPATSNQVTFGNDLNGDGKVTCPGGGTCEYITYKLTGSTLVRNATSTGSTSTAGNQAVVEFVEPNGLEFTYLDSNGDDYSGTNESKIHGVSITLNVRVEGGEQDGTQTLTTDVELRNRGGMALSAVPTTPADTTPPDTTITSGPSGTVTLTTADFGFSSSEGGSTFECRLDGGAWGACAPPKQYTGLPNGAHIFEVRAKDVAGNLDATPASRTWTVTISNQPPTAVNDGVPAPKNSSVNINVLANDTDPNGDTLSVDSFTQPSKGTVTKNADGTLKYTAQNGSGGTGTFTFTYKARDPQGNISNNATVTLTVS